MPRKHRFSRVDLATCDQFERYLIEKELVSRLQRQYSRSNKLLHRKERNMKPRHILPTLALGLVLAACGGATASESRAVDQSIQVAPAAPAMEAPGAPAAGGATALEQGKAEGQAEGQPQAPAGQQDLQRLVIKTADLSLQVDSPRDAEAALRVLVGQLGGYVVTAETSGTDEAMTARVTFRVPANRFDQALSGVQGLAKKVLARTVGGDDVTEEFVDLESRLKNLEASRDRMQSFLDQANTVEDALKVNQALSDLQGQIEQIKGRKQYLQQSAALSTISVSLSPVPAIAPIVSEAGWQPIGVARDALRGLVNFGQGLATLAIVVLVWAPVWLPFVLLGWWLRRRLRGRAPRPKATEAA
jgi:hypothetical protein